MPAPGYKNVAIPEVMYQKILELLKNRIVRSKFPYQNVHEFIRAAVSDKIREIEDELEKTLRLESETT